MSKMACLQAPCCSNQSCSFDDQKQFFTALGIPFPIIQGSSVNWRIRSKLAVRGTKGKPLIGLFREGSHEVYEIPHCTAHHPAINIAQKLVKEWMIAEGLTPYDEKSHSGDLRYLQFVVERSSGRIQGSFVLSVPHTEGVIQKWQLLFENLRAHSPPLFWHSLWLNFNPLKQNTIFGPDWQRIFGEEWLVEKIAGHSFYFLPGTFGQANLGLFEKLIEWLIAFLPHEKSIAEFYAGIGIIGTCLLSKAQKVFLIESNPESSKCFAETFQHLPKDLQPQITYLNRRAEEETKLLNEADVIIVDPPRKGLEPAFLQALASSSAKNLVYISCGWASFQGDCKELMSQGWKLKEAQGYHFFPGTSHIETLAIFEKD